MAVSSSITIQFCSKLVVEQLDIIDVLNNAGWTTTDHGKISYLPLGDTEMFDWQFQHDISHEELYSILNNKQAAGETIGIVMSWQNTNIGGIFLVYPNNEISISLSINRQKMLLENKYSLTDFNWYLAKLLPPLENAFGVECFSCEQQK